MFNRDVLKSNNFQLFLYRGAHSLLTERPDIWQTMDDAMNDLNRWVLELIEHLDERPCLSPFFIGTGGFILYLNNWEDEGSAEFSLLRNIVGFTAYDKDTSTFSWV